MWRNILGKMVCIGGITHHLRLVCVMEQASVQGEHEDAGDNCSCHSSVLARGPERKEGTRDAECWLGCVGFWMGKRRTVWLNALDLFLLFFDGVIHLSKVPRQKPIFKSLLFTMTTSALHLIYHFLSLSPVYFLPSLNDLHIHCHSTVSFPI